MQAPCGLEGSGCRMTQQPGGGVLGNLGSGGGTNPSVKVPVLRWERTRELLGNNSWKTTLSMR